MDYILPNFIAKALRRPSLRTQLESSLIGILCIMLSGLVSSFYIIIYTDMNMFIKILSGLGGIGIFLLMGSFLVTTYMQYYNYKLMMGLYPFDEQLSIKIKDAEMIVMELERLIEECKSRQKSKEKQDVMVQKKG